MRNKRFMWLAILLVSILVLSLVALACAAKSTTTVTKTVTAGSTQATSTQAAKTFKWRLQSIAVEGDALQNTMKGVAKLIEEASGGQVQVEVYPMNALVAIPDEFNAVKTRSIEAALVIPAFFSDVVPSGLACESAYAPGDVYQMEDIFNHWGFKDPLQEDYNKVGLYFMRAVYGGHCYIGTTIPINTAADFNRKPFFLVAGTLFLQKLGVVQTDIPGFDYYSGLKLGTVVGTTQAITLLESNKLYEVDKYYIKTAEFTAAAHLVINKAAWDELGADLQTRIQDHVDAHIFQFYQAQLNMEASAEKKARDYGVQFTTLPPEEEAKVRMAAHSDWDQIVAKNPGSAKAFQILKNWLKYNNLQ